MSAICCFYVNNLQSALQIPTLKITKIAIVILIFFFLTASAVLVAFWR